MLVNHEKQIIYFHIPRTGGTLVQKNLKKILPDSKEFWGWDKDGDLSHIHYERAKKYINIKTLENYKKICFVRNPYERLYSAFIVRKQKLIEAKIIKPNVNFNNFIINVLNNKNIFNNKKLIHFMPMYCFTHDINHNKKITEIYKHDDFKNNYIKLFESLDLVADVNFNNNNAVKSKLNKDNFMDNISQETIKKINEIYDLDFKYFDYSKL